MGICSILLLLPMGPTEPNTKEDDFLQWERDLLHSFLMIFFQIILHLHKHILVTFCLGNIKYTFQL